MKITPRAAVSGVNVATTPVTYAERPFVSVGAAGAGSISVRNVWKKISGACPAME